MVVGSHFHLPSPDVPHHVSGREARIRQSLDQKPGTPTWAVGLTGNSRPSGPNAHVPAAHLSVVLLEDVLILSCACPWCWLMLYPPATTVDPQKHNWQMCSWGWAFWSRGSVVSCEAHGPHGSVWRPVQALSNPELLRRNNVLSVMLSNTNKYFNKINK